MQYCAYFQANNQLTVKVYKSRADEKNLTHENKKIPDNNRIGKNKKQERAIVFDLCLQNEIS